MNVLSKLLDVAVENGVFSYHPKCKKISLTHLCFADDLLIFTKGKMDSIIGIQNVLKMFYSFSGLQINCAKCELFSSGVSREDLLAIQQRTGFQLGKLPVRYLGVPLVTRRLTERDCEPLVEKITVRIKLWTSNFLSYAGRLQLIQSVIASIQNYWCKHFVLPKGVIMKVNRICSSFLWKNNDQGARGARVSWDDVCYPKSEGGLGLKDLSSWNKACILQNIWSIIMKAGSLWIAWINEYILKGRSIWQISYSQTHSWNWRKILQLRNIAQRFVENRDGVEIWKCLGRKYSAAAVWQEIRLKKEKKDWHRVLWASPSIPKHVLITWMAILNRLPTMDRLEAWGMEVVALCRLCHTGSESRDHLFFCCSYSMSIWKEVLKLCGLGRTIGSWSEELRWVSIKLKGKALISIVLRIA